MGNIDKVLSLLSEISYGTFTKEKVDELRQASEGIVDFDVHDPELDDEIFIQVMTEWQRVMIRKSK